MRVEWKPDSLTNILMRANGNVGTNDGTSTSASATFSDDPYLYVDNPLAYVHDADSKIYPYLVNHNHGASLSYGENKNAWAMLQFYRRLNPRGRNVTLRVEGSIGDNDNRNASNNEVYLHRIKNQGKEPTCSSTTNYATTRIRVTEGHMISVTGCLTFSRILILNTANGTPG